MPITKPIWSGTGLTVRKLSDPYASKCLYMTRHHSYCDNFSRSSSFFRLRYAISFSYYSSIWVFLSTASSSYSPLLFRMYRQVYSSSFTSVISFVNLLFYSIKHSFACSRSSRSLAIYYDSFEEAGALLRSDSSWVSLLTSSLSRSDTLSDSYALFSMCVLAFSTLLILSVTASILLSRSLFSSLRGATNLAAS